MALECLRTNPQLRRELGRRGQQIVEEQWSTSVHLRRYTELVEELIDKKTAKEKTSIQVGKACGSSKDSSSSSASVFSAWRAGA